MTESERTQIFSSARNVLQAALPDAWAIYVYGSFARGDEWPSSDLDIAVLLPPKQHLPDKLDLIRKISTKTGREVDLVDLREAGLDLVRQVLRHGQLLFSARPDEKLTWEAERMTDYAEFNPRRRDIVNRYLYEPLLKKT